MNINGTTLIAIVTAPLIIGSLLGAPYQTRPNPKAAARPKPPDSAHSNYIRIEIRPGTKVAVVAPQVGDTVEWFPQPTNANPNPLPAVVTFQGKPPCEGHNSGDPISACKVNTKGNFEYDCDSKKNPCVDPGMDPRTQTGTILLATPARGGGGAPPPPPPPVPALALADGPPAVPTMRISCDQTQTPMVPQGKDPLAAYQSQQISWVAGEVSDFIINIPPKFCMEDTTGTGHIQADNVAVCTVAANADTTKPAYYSVSGVCPGNKTGNFTINVAKWPPTK